MHGLRSTLGYVTVSLVLAALVTTPFVLLPRFSKLIAGLGIRVHPQIVGGPVVRTLERGTYRVAISAPVGAIGPLEHYPRFVQVSWSPLDALPDRIDEQLDLDGDGRPEVGITFAVPKDPATPLEGEVNVLDPSRVEATTFLTRRGGFIYDLSALFVRLEDRVVARFPVKKRTAGEGTCEGDEVMTDQMKRSTP